MLATILGITLGIVLTSGVPSPAWQDAADQLPRDGAAFSGIRIEAGRGRIDVSAGASSAIEIRVAPERGAHAVPLRHSTSGGVLRLSLADDERDYIWAVVVPARFAAHVELDRGSVTVRGLEGGVTAAVGAGHGAGAGIDVEVPGGALDLRVDVGRIHAATRARAHGPVDVRSGVGNARLTVDGHEVVAARRPGPGHRLQLSGAAGDRLSLRVKVGDASLAIR